MAALTENKEVIEKSRRLQSHKMVASDIIYKGAIVKINAAGYAAPAAAEAGAVLAGIALEKCDNSAGSAGDIECVVLREGIYQLKGTGFAQSDVGSLVYASDDQTVSTTDAGNEIEMGKIVEFISSTAILVDIKA